MIKTFIYWRSDEIKRLVKPKRYLWPEYLALKVEKDYGYHKRQIGLMKNDVLVANSNSWKWFAVDVR